MTDFAAHAFVVVCRTVILVGAAVIVAATAIVGAWILREVKRHLFGGGQ